MSIRRAITTLLCSLCLAGCVGAGPLAPEPRSDEPLELLELAEMVDREGAAAMARR